MKKIKLDNGLTVSVDEGKLDNIELVDAMVDADDGNPMGVSRVIRILLNDTDRKALYDQLRGEDGRVPTSSITPVIVEIFTKLGEQGKN